MRPTPGSTTSLVILLLCVACLGGCSRLADALFLSPEKGSNHSPGALGMEYEDLTFPAGDGTQLHGWWLPGEAGQPTVLVLHNGTGNVGTRVDLLRQFHDWLGVGIFIIDYRGFGRSAGTPTDPGLAEDVAGALRLARSRGWDRDGLVLYGRGLGAALAAANATDSPSDGLVLEAAFPDLGHLQRARHPLLGSLLAPWLEGRFDTLGPAARLTVPTLFLHGDRDQEVPIGLGWQVYDICSAPKWFRTIVGATHDDAAFTGGESYWGAWRNFLAELREGRNAPPDAPP